MSRTAIICGLLLLATGFFGVFFPQLFGSPPKSMAGEKVNSVPADNPPREQKADSATNSDESQTSETRQVSRIDRIVVAGIVLPAAAGAFFLTVSLLGRWVSKTNSWFYVGMMGFLPPMLMLLLSVERIADWFTVPWSVHWVPVAQLLVGCVICTYAAFSFIQHGLPGNSNAVKHDDLVDLS